jgi:hypothetical protein
MPEIEEYDTDNPEHRANRGKIRAAIEHAANDQGTEGVVTQWIVIAEVCTSDGGVPSRELWFDDAYHDDHGLASWSRRGLMNEMSEELGL